MPKNDDSRLRNINADEQAKLAAHKQNCAEKRAQYAAFDRLLQAWQAVYDTARSPTGAPFDYAKLVKGLLDFGNTARAEGFAEDFRNARSDAVDEKIVLSLTHCAVDQDRSGILDPLSLSDVRERRVQWFRLFNMDELPQKILRSHLENEQVENGRQLTEIEEASLAHVPNGHEIDSSKRPIETSTQRDLSDLIAKFIRDVDAFLPLARRGNREGLPSGSFSPHELERIANDIEKTRPPTLKAKQALKTSRHELVIAMEAAGHYSSGVLLILHLADSRSNLARFAEKWAEVKVSLQGILLRMNCDEQAGHKKVMVDVGLLSLLHELIGALEQFLESGQTSERDDPNEVDWEAVEPHGYLHDAVRRVETYYLPQKLPAPQARNAWRDLLRTCRHENDLFKRQNEAHEHAYQLKQWAKGEIDRLGQTNDEQLTTLRIEATARSESTCRKKFITLTEEIIARIEEAEGPEWWFHVEPLSEKLESLRRQIDFSSSNQHDSNFPAFFITSVYRDHELHGIAAEFSSRLKGPLQRNDLVAYCVLLSRDPMVESECETTLWQKNRNSARKGYFPNTAKEAVQILRRWIRAVAKLDEVPLQIGDAIGSTPAESAAARSGRETHVADQPGDDDVPEKSAGSDQPSPVARSESGSVILYGRQDKPVVKGREKDILTAAQYDVVIALLRAGEKGLTKDELDRKSKHGDARKILYRLAEKDGDWKAAIQLPGKTGRGYRIP